VPPQLPRPPGTTNLLIPLLSAHAEAGGIPAFSLAVYGFVQLSLGRKHLRSTVRLLHREVPESPCGRRLSWEVI